MSTFLTMVVSIFRQQGQPHESPFHHDTRMLSYTLELHMTVRVFTFISSFNIVLVPFIFCYSICCFLFVQVTNMADAGLNSDHARF